MKCVISTCDEEGNNPIVKDVFLCGRHWFLIMNGLAPRDLLESWCEDIQKAKDDLDEMRKT